MVVKEWKCLSCKATTGVQEGSPHEPEKKQMTDEQIKYMVNRFLGWKLPENFNPDGGISFKRINNEHRPEWSYKNEPTGTNLFDYTQAEAMIRHLVDGLCGAEVEVRELREAFKQIPLDKMSENLDIVLNRLEAYDNEHPGRPFASSWCYLAGIKEQLEKVRVLARERH